MATVISGKDMLLFFRKRADHATADASKLRFQTEHSISMEKESESTQTKDGNIVTVSDGENSADISSLAYREDGETIEVWKELKRNFQNNDLMEMWQVDINSGLDGADLDADYYQGYFTAFELSSAADGNVELSYTFAINGNGAEGTDSLTPEQLAEVRNAQYDYETLKATGAGV